MVYMPQRVLFEEEALEYPLGKQLWERFPQIREMTDSHNRVMVGGEGAQGRYQWAKETLVVGVKRKGSLQSCKPSADYRLVLNTSCPGRCRYCYLATGLGERVYPRVYVNREEILEQAGKKVRSLAPELVTFESASSSDPVALEHLTGSLAMAIEYFANLENGRLRTVTKFTSIDGLLGIHHGGHTRFRFSLNAPSVVSEHEEGTSSVPERIDAARRLGEDGYPLGFIIAPIMVFRGWEEEYGGLLRDLSQTVGSKVPLEFELIQYRFTTRAMRVIGERFPETELDLSTQGKEHLGFGKYSYSKEESAALEEFFRRQIARCFPEAHIKYFV